MLLLTLRDLQHRGVRFAVVILGTTVVFALLLLMDGMAEHFSREPADTVAALRVDAWVLPNGVSGPFTSASTIDPRVAARISGVQQADPIITARGSLWVKGKPDEIIIIGTVVGGLGSPRVAHGSPVRSSGEIVVDSTTGLQPGDPARVGSATYTVAGVTNDTTLLAGIPIVFMSLGDAQEQVYRGQPIASAIVTKGHPAVAPSGLEVLSNAAVIADARHPLERAMSSINLIRFLLWIVSAMIIGGVVYLSSMERRRDFAVLKAVGGGNRKLLSGLAVQAAFIALIAAGFASLLQMVMAPTFPLKVQVTARALLQLPILAMIVALLASIAGMRSVAKTDPALAFSGPGA